MTCGVYVITCAASGKQYVGSSVAIDARWATHCYYLRRGRHQSPILQRSWTKHGSAAFYLNILEECVRDAEVLIAREQYHIDLMRPEFNVGTTARPGLGLKRSAETKEKMSRAQKGKPRPHSPGWAISAEGLERIAAARRGVKSPLRGVARSQEVREKISVAQKGKPREWQRGRKHSPETIAKMRVAALARSK